MSRAKIASKMIDHLEARINCENVMKYAEEYMDSKLGEGKEAIVNKLIIDGTPVAFKIMKYNDNPDYEWQKSGDAKDKQWVEYTTKIFDFMTEANYTGFEYFPYLYGVLNCHDGENSKLYIYYEVFEGNLVQLIDQMEHASEWYDVVFQMVLINYYIEVMNGYRYNDGRLKNHLYNKYSKPFYKNYEIENYKFTINHKYLIVLWDISYMEKITDENKNQIVSNLNFLLKYISNDQNNIKIMPSPRITKMLREIVADPEKSIQILDKYYNTSGTANMPM